MLFLCMTFVFTACTDKAEYTGAETPDGVQVYFPNTLSSTVDLSSSNTTFEVELRRIKTDEALTVNLTSVADISLFMIPSSVIFPAGTESVNISITYDPSKFEYDEYKAIALSVTEKSLTSIYGKSEYSFQAGVPAPWEPIGIATFTEGIWYGATVEVEIERHMLDPNRYRLVDPFDEIIAAEIAAGGSASSFPGTQNKYLEFKVNPAGSTIVGVTTTVEGLVSYGDINIGYHHPNYGEDVYMLHPSRFPIMGAESYWLQNIVKQYSADGEPEVVQLAPYYYLFEVNGGWNYTQASDGVLIVFPDVVIADYTAEVVYAGRLTDANDANHAVGNVTFGADVTSVKVAMISGSGIEAAVTAIKNGSLQSTEMSAGGQFSFPCEENGTYSFVVVTYANGEAKQSASATFRFTVPGQAVVEDPNWASLGMATYTDDFIASLYTGAECLTYQVEIQEHRTTSGLFRLVNPYGAAFPYNEPGDWDDTADYYMEINATDPTGVYIDLQDTGLNWGDGNLYVYSFAAYHMDNGRSLTEVKDSGYCGTYNGTEITFPVNALLCTLSGSTSLYYANKNGAFKVVMPTGTASTTSLKIGNNDTNRKNITKNLAGQPLRTKIFRKVDSFDLLAH